MPAVLTPSTSLSAKAYAQRVGILYLAIAVLGGFGIAYVPSQLTGETPAETVQLLHANEGLFRLGVLADTAVLLLEVIVASMLYVLLKPISATLATVSSLARFAMALVMAVNLLFYLAPYYLLSIAPAADNPLLLSQVQLYQQLHADGILAWGLFFGLHLACLATLLLRGGLVPKWIAYLVGIGSAGYVLEGLLTFVLPTVPEALYPVYGLLGLVTVGEFSLAIYLTAFGISQPAQAHA